MIGRTGHSKSAISVGQFLAMTMVMLLAVVVAAPATSAQQDVASTQIRIVGQLAVDGFPDRGVPFTYFDIFDEGRTNYLGLGGAPSGSFIRDIDVDPNGGVQCFDLTFVAPSGMTFINGTEYTNQRVCGSPGEVVDAETVLFAPEVAGATTIEVVTRYRGQGIQGTVVADLFAANADGSRSQYIESIELQDGVPGEFNVQPGCYVVVFVAPDQPESSRQVVFYNDSKWLHWSGCVAANGFVSARAADLSFVSDPTFITGVIDDGTSGAEGIVVDLFGPFGTFITDAQTDADGRYSIEVDPGCYEMVFVGPEGSVFEQGYQRWGISDKFCIETGNTVTENATLSLN